MSNPIFKQKVLASATTSSAATTFVTTEDILVGEYVVVAMGKTALSTTTNGILSITTSAGVLAARESLGVACIASTFNVDMARSRCTTLIPAGSTITCNSRSANTKRGGIMQVIAGLDNAPAWAHSGNAADNTAGNVSGGPNGTTALQTAGTTTAAGEAPSLLLGAHSYGGTNTNTPDASMTEIDKIKTTSGSADRGVQLLYKLTSVIGSVQSKTTQSSAGSWAAVCAALPYTATPTFVAPVALDFDALTEGATPTASSPWSVLATGTTTVKATSAKHSSKGINVPLNCGGYSQIRYTEALHGDQRVGSMYVRFNSANSANVYMQGIRTSGSITVADWRVNPDGTVAIRNNGTAVATSVASLVRDGTKWYRFDYMAKALTGGQELRVYEEESATPIITLTGALTTPDRLEFVFGMMNYVASTSYDMDTLRVSDTWLAPFGTTPTGPVFKEWNGTAWVTVTPKEWDGAAWDVLTAKEL